ncbi:MAG: universal stress protein [Steroidobacteraceae bacterium]
MPVLKRILVATDLSAASQRAVMRAGQLARQWEANLFLVHARPDWNLFARWRPAAQDSYQDVARSADEPLRKILGAIRSEFGVQAQCHSRVGKASNVVAAMAAELQPHLLVIGARGEHEACGPSGCLGGTALKLLMRIETPLLIVRRPGTVPYSSALVAIDLPGSLSRRAVLWGSGLVADGECRLVHAFDVPYLERMRLQEVDEVIIERRMRQAEEAANGMVREALGAAEGRAKLYSEAIPGEPVGALLERIERLAPHVVVLGKSEPQAPQGQGGPIGGVGFRIAYHVPTDVLVLSS